MSIKERLLQKSNLWHVAAVAVFLLIACLYLYPVLQGYSLKQSDITNYIGGSREIQDYRDNDGEQVLWTGSMFSGMPSTQIAVQYEGTWLSKTLWNVLGLGLPVPVFYLFVYFLGFYVLSLSLRIKPLVAIVGSIAFGLSSYYIIILEAGHNSKAGAIGFAAFMVAGFIMAYRFKNWVLGAALSAVFMMIELAANHLQITYYALFLMFFMGIVELIRHIQNGELARFLKITGLVVLGYGLAFMVNYGNISGTARYSENTIRGGTELTIDPTGAPREDKGNDGLDKAYVTNWSYGISETFSLMVPNFKGGETIYIGSNDANKNLLKDVEPIFRSAVAQSSQYWGDQPGTSGPVYVGIIVLFIAFLALVYVKEKYKWALLTVTLLTIALSWGKNFVPVFILVPILLYLVNIFLPEKKQLTFSIANTAFFFLVIALGPVFGSTSLTDFFLDVVPGYDKFRAVTMVLSITELCIPLLAVLFLHYLVAGKKEDLAKNLKGILVAGGIFMLVLLAFLIAPTAFNDFLSTREVLMLEQVTDPAMYDQYSEFYATLEEARVSIFRKDVLRSLGFFVAALLAVLAYLKANVSKPVFLGVLGVLIFADLLLVDLRYLNTEKRGTRYAQWEEDYVKMYPYSAGDGEKQILAMEVQANPAVQVKIDSALTVLDKTLKEEKASGREKQLRRDYLAFRVLNRNTNFRVADLADPFNSTYVSYFFKSMGGYHGAKLARYQDIIEFHLSRNNPSVHDMLNVKYYIAPVRDDYGTIVNSALIKTNPTALGNAWFSKNIRFVKDADEEILALNAYDAYEITAQPGVTVFVDGDSAASKTVLGQEKIEIQLPGMPERMPINDIPYDAAKEQPLALVADSAQVQWMYDVVPDSVVSKLFKVRSVGRSGWDPTKETIMDMSFDSEVDAASYTGEGTIEMVAYHPDRLVYRSSSPAPQLAVFSEIYYPDGWKAYVNNEEVPVLRANYLLRAIELPAGDNTIEFVYELDSYKTSATVANIGSLGILILLGLGIFLGLRKESAGDAAAADRVE